MPAKLLVPKPSEFRDAGLRIERSALIRRGVADPNVQRGSDAWIRWEALSQQLAVVTSNTQLSAEATMPDTAVDDDLVRILSTYGILPLDAQPSAGPVVLNSSASTFIVTGALLFDSAGQFWRVDVGGTYAPGANVPLVGVSTGASTNVPQGTVLQWYGSPPAFSDPKALVGVGGLIGGLDTDTNESARNRLFNFFRNPPKAGNWTQVAGFCTGASPSAQAAYVYPAINGPATLGVCVVGALTFDVTNGWSRGVSDAVLALVQASLTALLPEGVGVPGSGLVVKTAKDTGGAAPNVDADVAIGLAIPLAASAGGAGGGWRNAVPWPDLLGAATHAYVSLVTSSTQFTITSDDAAFCPSSVNLVVGQTEVAWFSAVNFAAGLDPIVTATVTSVSGVVGAIVITVSVPFTEVAVGDFIFPNAENVQAYARGFLNAIGAMGPGQWTTHPQVLVHGARRPLVTASNPSDLTGTQLRAVTDAGSEVADVAYLYRNVSSPGTPPTTTADSPYVIVPRRFGFFNKIL